MFHINAQRLEIAFSIYYLEFSELAEICIKNELNYNIVEYTLKKIKKLQKQTFSYYENEHFFCVLL